MAFVPPDSCQEVKAAGPTAREVDSVMKMRCGVVMSELERQAASVGFEVVSWQQMGAGIESAKASRVDLLFEVNELTLDAPPQELNEAGRISFAREGQPVVVPYPERVAARCANSFLGSLPPTLVATLDLKMIDVRSERVGWFYRDMVPMDEARDFQLQQEFVAAGVPNPWLNDIAGAALLAALIAAVPPVVVGVLWLEDPDGIDAETRDLASLSLGVAAGAAGVGAASYGLAHAFPEYPAPEQVLCVPAYAARTMERPPVRRVTPYGSEVEVQSRRSVNRDAEEEARRRLIEKSVARFMQRLSSYRDGAAPAAPAAR